MSKVNYERLEKNVAKAKEIISYVSNNRMGKDIYGFQRPYIFSNEGDFYSYLNLKGKNVITVGSSIDQALYCKLYGANNVTLFDLNPFVPYNADLKSAAIQCLDRSQTKRLFSIKPTRSLDFGEVVTTLSSKMSEESTLFWQELGKEFKHKQIIKGLYKNYGSRYPSFLQNDRDYLMLRHALKNSPDISFISSSFHDLTRHLSSDAKFDVALISNVLDYYEPVDYKEDVCRLLPFMKKDGLIQVNYSYNYPNEPNNIIHPNKLETVSELFGLSAINGKIYPHLRDVLPAPMRNTGSFALPINAENPIFVSVEDLRFSINNAVTAPLYEGLVSSSLDTTLPTEDYEVDKGLGADVVVPGSEEVCDQPTLSGALIVDRFKRDNLAQQDGSASVETNTPTDVQ